MSATCPACKAGNDAQAKFCKSCGAALGSDVKEPASPPPAAAPKSTKPPVPERPVAGSPPASSVVADRKPFRGKAAMVGVVIVSIVLVVGGGILVATGVGMPRVGATVVEPATIPSPASKANEEADRLANERAAFEAERRSVEEQKAKLATAAAQGTSLPTEARASTGPESDVVISRMIDASVRNADAEVKDLKIQGDGLPKPARGDRKFARGLNTDAMALLNEGKFAEAIAILKKASAADPADVEIVDNLGYAALRGGNLDEAKRSSFAALAIAPGRSSAWASLGVVLAQTESEAKAVAAFANAYRFSGNTAKTIEYLEKLGTDDPNPKVRNAAIKALDVVKALQ